MWATVGYCRPRSGRVTGWLQQLNGASSKLSLGRLVSHCQPLLSHACAKLRTDFVACTVAQLDRSVARQPHRHSTHAPLPHLAGWGAEFWKHCGSTFSSYSILSSLTNQLLIDRSIGKFVEHPLNKIPRGTCYECRLHNAVASLIAYCSVWTSKTTTCITLEPDAEMQGLAHCTAAKNLYELNAGGVIAPQSFCCVGDCPHAVGVTSRLGVCPTGCSFRADYRYAVSDKSWASVHAARGDTTTEWCVRLRTVTTQMFHLLRLLLDLLYNMLYKCRLGLHI